MDQKDFGEWLGNNFSSQLPTFMSHGKRLTTEKYVEKAIKVHGTKYDYSKVVYVHSMLPVEIICKNHGSFTMIASAHLSGSGCQKCGRDSTKGDTEAFLTKARNMYGNRFDYTNTKYITLRTKVEIICPEHGMFKIYPWAHLIGNGGCRSCSRNKPLTTEEFVQRANATHNNKYDYSKTEYTSARNKVIVLCKVHGEFQVTAYDHMRRNGCAKCVRTARTLTTEHFVKKAIAQHGDEYDYSKVVYVASDKKVEIVCPKHGVFLQTPAAHLTKNGCQKCTRKFSRSELQWLDSLGVPLENRQKHLRMRSGKRYQVDGYDPKTNTVYEFNGDYWHGNPQKYKSGDINRKNNTTFGVLFENTQNKLRELLENGYNVISIWENDFKKK